MVLDMEGDSKTQLILGHPFLLIARILIDVEKGLHTIRIGKETTTFQMFMEVRKSQQDIENCFNIDIIDSLVMKDLEEHLTVDILETTLRWSDMTTNDNL